MGNIWSQRKDYVDSPKRNTFDMSFQNNLTMEFGKLYPVFCKEVLPGDSFKIDPTFALKFMPMQFPVMTRMQANLHFFYVRNRNLWKDWPDFIGRTKSDLVTPFLSPRVAKKVAQTRKLGDYLGIPTTLVGDYGSSTSFVQETLTLWNGEPAGSEPYGVNYYPVNWSVIETDFSFMVDRTESWQAPGSGVTSPWPFGVVTGQINYSMTSFRYTADEMNELFDVNNSWSTNDYYVLTGRSKGWENLDLSQVKNGSMMIDRGTGRQNYRMAICLLVNDKVAAYTVGANLSASPYPWSQIMSLKVDEDNKFRCFIPANMVMQVEGGSTKQLSELVGENSPYLRDSGNYRMIVFCVDEYDNDSFGEDSVLGLFTPSDIATINPLYRGITELSIPVNNADAYNISAMSDDLNPYASGDVKISALPFRAYESIYNAFYRNQQNDPFTINGVVEYNKFIPTNEGGSDDTDYDLHYRNWEMDFLTSATQTPQQGDITPLVGVSASGKFTFQNEDGTQYVVTPILGEDGSTLTGISSYEGTPENNSGIRRLMDLIPYGISINDFRNVNALQRWLETNLRRGFRYRDQIKSHFDVDVEYKELDMPEFIGGMSEPVLVNQVNQSVGAHEGTFDDVLGSFSGQASIIAGSEHSITHYCDEHGMIIGILSVSPVPNYSQLLPKMFVKENVLDYYFPEFGHIGNQPITYQEVTPNQVYAAYRLGEDSTKLTDVFGYQRAWYDYLASVDEVHGLFRTSEMRNFLINRVFDSRPELGKEFLQVDPDQINDVFSVTDMTDKILGQVYFQVSAQRPIPKFGIPRLE